MQFPSHNAWPTRRHSGSAIMGTPGPSSLSGGPASSKVPGTRQFHILVGIAATLFATAVMAIGLTIWALRGDAVQDTSRDVGHVATILAAQTAQSVEAIDTTLVDFGAHLSALEKDDPAGFATTLRSRKFHQELADRIAHLPQATIFAVVSAAGHTVADSKAWPAPDIDVNDREYFAAQKGNPSAGLYVNPLVKSRGDGSRMLFFSRRLEAHDGKFLGILVIGLDLAYFRRMYDALESLPDLSFVLLRSDGTVLLRYPDAIDRVGDRLPNGSPWYDVVSRGTGYFRSVGFFDTEPRYIAVRQVAGYPFVVNAAKSEAAALASWQHRAATIAAGSALMLICSGFLLRALYVQFRKLSASQASLAEREIALSRQSQELAGANAQIDAALNNMSQGLCMFDDSGRLVICNQRYLAIYQIPQQIAQPGVRFADLLSHIQSTGQLTIEPDPFIQERLAQGFAVHDTARLRDGRIIQVTNEPMPGGGWVATHDDITERQRNEAHIARMARHDALTDLANRVLFRERADAAVQRYHKTGNGYTVLVFDLDLFKAVNDSLGHPVGDALLKSVAARIQSVVVQPDTVGRLGGDEFAILQIAGANQREDAARLAGRLLDAIQEPHHIDGHRIVVGTSIGIAMAPDHGLAAEDLLKNADVALYRAKSEGRGAYRFFEPEMDRELRLRRALEVDLHNALAEEQFEAYYQPLVNADDGTICSVEALVRWRRPQQGIVTPDRFIPVAEERGLVSAIDRWMLMRACCDAVAWPEAARVAVNLSPAEFQNGDIVEIIAQALRKSQLPAGRLELEITESVLLQNNARNISLLHQIKNLGVSIVLDDFGTGYSSLSYLRLFPFDKIKIDQSFVREMPSRADCNAIVCAIANLGRELNIVTVAEGVETVEQLELVRAAGCKQVQGFLFSRPGPASQLVFPATEAVPPRRAAAG